ncbi:MAG: 16S rRNA (uracil(1498)-N(3))-methyltransferase [Gemmataceae bacterium]|nr:16S rRNA (uracil(1498)-N(3))-methyltransferase [Gemmataceae bacterium]
MSDRFFFDDPLYPNICGGQKPGDIVELEGQEAHHLSSVRRFKPDDLVTLFNGDGHEYPARILDVAKKRIRLQVMSVETPERELGFALHIASALPKGDRGDFLIEKLTELGVTDFTPLMTERSIVKLDDAKTEKLRRAVIEASKQCGRNVVMRVHPPAPWLEWCVKQPGLRFLANPDASQSLTSTGADAIVAIGPEGGFSTSEIQAALQAGWETFSLGSRVLRVETAAIVAATRLSGSHSK